MKNYLEWKNPRLDCIRNAYKLNSEELNNILNHAEKSVIFNEELSDIDRLIIILPYKIFDMVKVC